MVLGQQAVIGALSYVKAALYEKEKILLISYEFDTQSPKRCMYVL